MPVCKQLHLVAHANTASVVFQKPHLLLGKQKTKVTEVRIPLAEEYSMADVWCVVPAGCEEQEDAGGGLSSCSLLLHTVLFEQLTQSGITRQFYCSARGRWGRETMPFTCRGQSDCPLPAASMLLYSERMLGDKFRASTRPPSATASCKPVSMGTAARLPGVKIG
ncbi:Vertnin [Clarias magur]|uniref:Vertnin n=1 Tax=Clarias magur TaxID=1594786 RepID=A0A8J4UDT3_CLAMG|nr:Vertnin [Clarias magur]